MGTESVSGNLILRKQPVLYFKHSQHISFLVYRALKRKKELKTTKIKKGNRKAQIKAGKDGALRRSRMNVCRLLMPEE